MGDHGSWDTPKTKAQKHVTNLFLDRNFLDHVGIFIGFSEEIRKRVENEQNDQITLTHFQKIASLFGTHKMDLNRGQDHFIVLVNEFDIPQLMIDMINGKGPINAQEKIEHILSEYLEASNPSAEISRNPKPKRPTVP